MLRRNYIVVAALFALLLPQAADAENLKLLSGEFTFAHAPVDPTATEFHITSDSFDGQFVSANANIPILKKGANFPGHGLPFQRLHLPFAGMGEAVGGLIANPTSTKIAEFSGSFTWETEQGDLLHGDFVMENHFIGLEGVFGATIVITFDGGTGRFANASGQALAQGLDFPFGGLGGDGSAAGVQAVFIGGDLWLN